MLEVSAVGLDSLEGHQAFASVGDGPSSVAAAQLLQKVLISRDTVKLLFLVIFEEYFKIIGDLP